jgi:hypothetical protein
MRRFMILFFGSIAFLACRNPQDANSFTTKISKEEKAELPATGKEKADSEAARKWLIETVDYYFKPNKEDWSDMKGITTKTYEEYKVDAINVDLGTDGALTLSEFENKWRKKFDTKYAGIGVGFLVPEQDIGTIEVTSCKLLKCISEKKYLFEMIIRDSDFKREYKREIEVIRSSDSLLISDVKEFN